MKQTILVIEDDPLSARLANLILDSAGYQVVLESNGLQGLKIAQDISPDLILLDLMLPGLDGFAFLSHLRSDPRTAGVGVAVVSSKSQPDDKQMAARVGADAYLTKPYRKAELLDTVRSLLSEKAERAEGRGNGVLLVGPRGNEATPVALGIGLTLADQGETTTVIDLRPFSVEHSLRLDVTPLTTPVSLSEPEMVGRLASLTTHHPGGLRLLNNMEGSGQAGQLMPQDASVVLDALLAEEGVVLIDLPLYPADVLQRVADRCGLVLLVVQGDPASLAAARSALTLMVRAGVDMERIGVVLVGPGEQEHVAELGLEILGTVPAEAKLGDPVFQVLADRLRDLRQPSAGGGAQSPGLNTRLK